MASHAHVHPLKNSFMANRLHLSKHSSASSHSHGSNHSLLSGHTVRSRNLSFHAAKPMKQAQMNLDLRMPAKIGINSVLMRYIILLLLMLLIREWMEPLLVLSNVEQRSDQWVFYLFVGGCLLIDEWNWHAFVSWPAKAIMALFTLGMLYYPDSSAGFGWLYQYIEVLERDAAALLIERSLLLSGENRTLLFMFGWLLLATVVHAIVLQRQQAIWLLSTSLIYLAGLQLLLEVNTTGGTMRALVISVLLISLVRMAMFVPWSRRVFQRVRMQAQSSDGMKLHASTAHRKQYHSIGGERRWGRGMAAWVAGIIFLLMCGLFAGAYSSQTQLASGEMKSLNWEKLSDPLMSYWSARANMEHGVNRTDMAQLGRTGYGTNDERLGGAIKPSEELVFSATTEQMTYWRGETRSFYTGKGWVDHDEETIRERASTESMPSGSFMPFEQGLTAEDETALINKKTIKQEVSFAATVSPQAMSRSLLFLGGELVRVDTMVSSQGKDLSNAPLNSDERNGRIALRNSHDRLAYYKVEVQLPEHDETILREAITQHSLGMQTLRQQAADQQEVDLRMIYTQLPDSVPLRVKALATFATVGISHPYDKAKAVETFLQQQFTYTMSDVKKVPEDRDFVDYFLFDEKKGYCDYFSTAMVVMLRSLGIPARWVKGFAPGELVAGPADEAGDQWHVLVRNADAHSWVEAYFQGVGWIPFDPTPAGPAVEALASFDVLQQGEGQAQGSSADLSATINNRWQEEASDAEPGNNDGWQLWQWLRKPAAWMNWNDWNKWSIWDELNVKKIPIAALWIIGLVSMIIVGIVVIRRCRAQLSELFIFRGYSKTRHHPDYLEHIINRMWGRVFRTFGSKRSDQTWREYAEALPHPDAQARESYLLLVEWCERRMYHSPEKVWIPKQQLRTLWKRIRVLCRTHS